MGKKQSKEQEVQLSSEFSIYRRTFFERHEDLLTSMEQQGSPLAMVPSEIITLIRSFMDLSSCCALALTSRLMFHYWFGDMRFWCMKIPSSIATQVLKYQPFSKKEINVTNWRDLCFHIKHNTQWKKLTRQFQIVSSEHRTAKKSFSFDHVFSNGDDLRQFFPEGKQSAQVVHNNTIYLSALGNSDEGKDVESENSTPKRIVLFVNLGSRSTQRSKDFLRKYAFVSTKYILIVTYYAPIENTVDQRTEETRPLFWERDELDYWKRYSYLFNKPYLEFVDFDQPVSPPLIQKMIQTVHCWNIFQSINMKTDTNTFHLIQFLLTHQYDF